MVCIDLGLGSSNPTCQCLGVPPVSSRGGNLDSRARRVWPYHEIVEQAWGRLLRLHRKRHIINKFRSDGTMVWCNGYQALSDEILTNIGFG